MENALYAGMAAHSRKGIAVRFPVMNDHRQGQFPGKGQLRLKKKSLLFTVGIGIVIVQTDFSQRHDFLFLPALFVP